MAWDLHIFLVIFNDFSKKNRQKLRERKNEKSLRSTRASSNYYSMALVNLDGVLKMNFLVASHLQKISLFFSAAMPVGSTNPIPILVQAVLNQADWPI